MQATPGLAKTPRVMTAARREKRKSPYLLDDHAVLIPELPLQLVVLLICHKWACLPGTPS